MVTLDAVKVSIEHGEPCRCRVLDGAIYVGPTCQVIGAHVTKRRIAQLVHGLKQRIKMLTEFDLLIYAGLHRVSILAAAHALDPDDDRAPIALVVRAIDLRRTRGTGTKAGDYYDECLEAALDCAYVWQ